MPNNNEPISQGRISATRGAAILGLSSYSTPFKAWQDIMERRQPGFNAAHDFDYEPFEGNTATRWGKAFESEIITLAMQRQGLMIHNREYHAFHKDYDYIHCYIDGSYKHPDKILHEGKTASMFAFNDSWGEPGTDKVPIDYQIQTQHQMLCTGANRCIISVLVFPKRPEELEKSGLEVIINPDEVPRLVLWQDEEKTSHKVLSKSQWAFVLAEMGFFHQYIIEANPELQQRMIDHYFAWWSKYVLTETPPPVESYDDIKRMITKPCGTIILNEDATRWYKEYDDIGKEIGATGNLSKRRDQLKMLIIQEALKLDKTIDDNSTDKFIFMDTRGKKLGSYSKGAKGMVFR